MPEPPMPEPSPYLGTITVDARDGRALARWWAQVLLGRVDEYAEADAYVVRADTLRGINLNFQTVDAPTPGKNRMHLDLGADDRAAVVQRLAGLGAAVLHDGEVTGLGWTTLTDPEGNQFCVSDPAPTP
ncbi:VOC family protein [Rhodococcus hoagii]|nr:VOC family protein [Prescottella equi]